MKLAPAAILSLALLFSGCRAKRSASSAPGYKRQGSELVTTKERKEMAEPTRRLLDEASRWLGTPYRYGASERGKGADCSGLVVGVFNNALSLKLPRSSRDQAAWCARLKGVKEAIPGDLIFFAPGGKGRVNHVGIYLGEGRFVHTSSSKGVMVSSLDEPYFTRNYAMTGRVEPYFAMVGRRAPEPAPMPATRPEVSLDSLGAVLDSTKAAETKAVETKPAAKKAETKAVKTTEASTDSATLDAAEARRRLLLRLSEEGD
ncbi:MAG: C40 family peptidase [Pseudoflavonifractor sp.]|nr:C40 family peptidase [Alloprevotella sp.]MCM1116927.1 C40 family peptidase [Pseudoflavonifractor sp.]